MTTTYTCVGGEVIDEIIVRFYGLTGWSHALKQVLNANQGLAKQALNLPAGTMITLPTLPHDAPALSRWA